MPFLANTISAPALPSMPAFMLLQVNRGEQAPRRVKPVLRQLMLPMRRARAAATSAGRASAQAERLQTWMRERRRSAMRKTGARITKIRASLKSTCRRGLVGPQCRGKLPTATGHRTHGPTSSTGPHQRSLPINYGSGARRRFGLCAKWNWLSRSRHIPDQRRSPVQRSEVADTIAAPKPRLARTPLAGCTWTVAAALDRRLPQAAPHARGPVVPFVGRESGGGDAGTGRWGSTF